MKDYHEMTQSVLQQANVRAAQRTRQRRMATGLIAATLCFAILIAVVGFGVGRNPAGTTQPTISLENPTTVPTTQPETTEPTQQDIIVHTGNVYFLSAMAEGNELIPMQANMTLPVNCMFRVRSLKGMTESERDKAIQEEYSFKRDFAKKYGNSDGGYYSLLVAPENTFSNGKLKVRNGVVIQYLSGGKASLILLNASEIESFDTETTGVLRINGGYGTYNQDVTIGEGESAVTIPEGCLRIYLHLGIGDEMYMTLKKDPDTPLSALCDTITVTINYKNGTKEIVVIDVTVDDEGYVYMTQRGNNTGV
jgi:hypothetical protein